MQTVSKLGSQISEDYKGKQPVLVGVQCGMICFMADLMREISLPAGIDFMSISYWGIELNVSVRQKALRGMTLTWPV